MPCSEIADAIVQTGRESLERARKIIHEHREWGADVVYGDTDSLFVWLPGKTKDNAFSIGYDMADKITSTNVAPVKLKFEKVISSYRAHAPPANRSSRFTFHLC